jgi:hypothetical protein
MNISLVDFEGLNLAGQPADVGRRGITARLPLSGIAASCRRRALV